MTNPPSDGIGGPLAELFGRVADDSELPYAPLHTRLLEVALDGEEIPAGAWVLAAWADPGGPRALHDGVKARVEATLLQELSRSAASFRGEGRKRFEKLWLFAFDQLPNPEAALRAFALSPRDWNPEMSQALAYLRQEASAVGLAAPDDPVAIYEARVVHRPEIELVEAALIAITKDDELWGREPGAAFARLRDVLHRHELGGFDASLPSLEALEKVLVPDCVGAIRWVPPLVFQGLADLIAVLANREGRRAQWAVCEPEEDGQHPAPLFRFPQDGGFVHVPIGVELLRWCVMPVHAGEEVPSLADWTRDAFDL